MLAIRTREFNNMTLVYILILVLLLLLNAFFVVAEFAAVRVRGTQIAALKNKGRNTSFLDHIHSHIDEYLAVCQLGITFTSIGLGFGSLSHLRTE